MGDKLKYLSLLVTLKCEIDPADGTPSDTLLPSTQEWLKSLGCPATTVTEVLKAGPDPKLLAAIQSGIDRANQKATSRAQRIQKVAILPVDFSLPTGELGRQPINHVYFFLFSCRYFDYHGIKKLVVLSFG